MIVDRRTYNIKLGQAEEAVELIKAELVAAKEASHTYSYRVYVCQIGQWGQVAVEFEFDNLAQQEAFWSGWRPKNPEFIKDWFGLNQGEIQIAIWDLAASG
jgi:hypothetical protein